MRKICAFSVLSVLFLQMTLAQSAKSTPVDQTKGNTKEIRTGGYNFINPLLDCYDIKSSSLASNKQLELKLNEFIKKAVAEKKIESASVYYRDLSNGPWIGIREEDLYSPASLLKVPYLIAALYQAQEDPSFLSKKVKFTESVNVNPQSIKDSVGLIAGNSYTINELLYIMIVHSDNNAKDLLMQYLSPAIYLKTFNELGINIEKYDAPGSSTNFLSVKDYASFFRVLYNATFLNKQMSERALSLLTNTTFLKGIVAGVPDTITVAHKFGERFFFSSDTKQLHDCGIVYKQDQPYILCIMTKGKDNNKMEKVIADISKLIYTHLEINKKNNYIR